MSRSFRNGMQSQIFALRIAALALASAGAAFAQAPPLPPLNGHWQCLDVVTNGGKSDYYEFDFSNSGRQTTAWKTSGSRYVASGNWVLDPSDDSLLHISSSGETCNQYGFRCRDYDSHMNFAFALLSSSALEFRTNGVVLKCQRADGQIDVDNWQPSTTEKIGSILNWLGKAAVIAGNTATKYEQMQNGTYPGGSGAEGDGANPADAYNDSDATAAAGGSDLAKRRRINFLNWAIPKDERALAGMQNSLNLMSNPAAISGQKRNISRLQDKIARDKAELARLGN